MPGEGSKRLVVAGRTEGESADELASFGDDADVLVVHEQCHAPIPVDGAETDVVEATEVAQGDEAVFVVAVVTHAVVGGRLCERWAGLDARVVRGERRAPWSARCGLCWSS